MDTLFANEDKAAYWEALYKYIRSAQQQEQSLLDWPTTEEGLERLGNYYTRAADLLSPVLWCAYGDGGPINTLLTFAIITRAHFKEIADNPRSIVSLHTLAIQNYPRDLTDELWGEMERILEVWACGYFRPMDYPATFEQTMGDDTNDEEEQSSSSASSARL